MRTVSAQGRKRSRSAGLVLDQLRLEGDVLMLAVTADQTEKQVIDIVDQLRHRLGKGGDAWHTIAHNLYAVAADDLNILAGNLSGIVDSTDCRRCNDVRYTADRRSLRVYCEMLFQRLVSPRKDIVRLEEEGEILIQTLFTQRRPVPSGTQSVHAVVCGGGNHGCNVRVPL